MSLNEKQEEVMEMVMEGKNVFITGVAGSGKSFLIKKIKEWADDNGKNTAITAMTGVAASNINGSTLHYWGGIGLGKSNGSEMEVALKKSMYYIKRNKATLSRYTDTDILIVDEISMLDAEYITKLNALAKMIRRSPLPFGGIQLVFTGDFYQLGPIKSKGFIFEDAIFDELLDVGIYLTKVYRQRNSDFIDMLHKIRVGNIDDAIVTTIQKTSTNKLENDMGIEPTLLFCKNVDVEAMNGRGIKNLDGKEYCFMASDNFTDDATKKHYGSLFTYPTSLVLKKGAQVMLLKNMDVENGLVNGSRGIITSINGSDSVMVKFMDGKEHEIKKIAQQFTDNGTEVVASRQQFPLKLAYALTIHKSQGLSIDYLHVDVKGAFCHGQVYVALSRATSFDNLRVTNFQKGSITTSKKVCDYYKKFDNDATITYPKKRKSESQINTYFKKSKNG